MTGANTHSSENIIFKIPKMLPSFPEHLACISPDFLFFGRRQLRSRGPLFILALHHDFIRRIAALDKQPAQMVHYL